MRNAVLLVGATLGLIVATPALASGGLPRLGELHAGPHQVVLYNDSPGLVVGQNTLSLELPPGVSGDAVQLALLHKANETLLVSMHPVIELANADAGATSHGDAAGAHAPAPPGHDMHGMTMPMPVPTAGYSQATMDAMPGMGSTAPMVRGTVNVPSEGSWRVHLTVTDQDGHVYADEITLEAAPGGPNQLYLIATGSLIAGALFVGLAARHPRVRTSLARTVHGREGRSR